MPNDALIAIVAALGTTLGATAIRLVDWWGARKVGIGALQHELVSTLQDTNRAQRERIETLEHELAMERSQRIELGARVTVLEGLLRDALTAPASRRRLTRSTTTTEESR